MLILDTLKGLLVVFSGGDDFILLVFKNVEYWETICSVSYQSLESKLVFQLT